MNLWPFVYQTNVLPTELISHGQKGRIWTFNLLIPNQALYQIELLPENGCRNRIRTDDPVVNSYTLYLTELFGSNKCHEIKISIFLISFLAELLLAEHMEFESICFSFVTGRRPHLTVPCSKKKRQHKCRLTYLA